MINKKVFALTLVASSVIAAGCSSDDDDDDEPASPVDMTSDAVATDAQSTDVNGDGVLDDDDDINGDGFIDGADVTAFMGMDPDPDPDPGNTLVDNTTDAVTPDANSTDVDGDGSLGDGDDVDMDGDIDDDDVTAFNTAVLPSGDDYEAPVGTVLNLAELAANTPQLTVLAEQAGNCPDIAAALSDPESRLTVFAPSNDAFGAQEVTDALGAGADVCDVIAGHVLVGTVASSTDLAGNVGRSAMTLAGTSVDIAEGAEAGSLTVGGAAVVGADNFATNGVAHVIGSVILPMEEDDEEMEPGNGDPDPTGPAGEVGPVVTAINAAGNTDFVQLANNTVGSQSFEDNPWTVFAPTNDQIDDGLLSGTPADQNAVAQNHIAVNTGALDADALGALSEITTNGGNTYQVTNTGGAITVGGFPVTLITAGDTGSAVYSIEGVLQ